VTTRTLPKEYWARFPVAVLCYRSGVDPKRVSMESVTPFWYREFVVDSLGNRVSTADGTWDYVARWWPNPFWGFRIWVEWLRDYRRVSRDKSDPDKLLEITLTVVMIAVPVALIGTVVTYLVSSQH
jgi:hypothetical protein